MSVEVCTVFAARNGCNWKPYLPLIELQRQSVELAGHSYRVVNDDNATLSAGLMAAMIDGVIHRLRMGGDSHLLFVDVDCLILRACEAAFDGTFQLGLTRRENELAPINNGAMYVHRDGIQAAIPFFEYARSICAEHWGGDQEAISQAASPVPTRSGVIDHRRDCKIAFLSMALHNAVPKVRGKFHHSRPYVLHFKGATKDWMQDYAERYLFKKVA